MPYKSGKQRSWMFANEAKMPNPNNPNANNPNPGAHSGVGGQMGTSPMIHQMNASAPANPMVPAMQPNPQAQHFNALRALLMRKPMQAPMVPGAPQAGGMRPAPIKAIKTGV